MTDNEAASRTDQRNSPVPENLLTSAEVADLLRVAPKTVSRWATQGLVDTVKTPGGHRRFRESVVQAILNGGQS